MNATVDLRRRVDTVWRIESARVVGALARIVGDLGVAEDLAQDAVVAALEQWPRDGIPDSPGAWLTAVARRRWVDAVRRDVVGARTLEQLGRERGETVPDPTDEVETARQVRDDVLRLMFAACHPVLAREARVALTLRLVGGLTTAEIARAFLLAVPTVAARLTRAKKALRAAQVRIEVPVGNELFERLASVLEAVYLVFNEGYAATTGESWMRTELCDEAMRLGRVLSRLVPDEPEVLGLLALMELQASRLRARTAPDGSSVRLLDQDRNRWDRLLITHGLAALERARALGGDGSYVLQASIAACHARAATAERTDWAAIAGLYADLVDLTKSPVVELNRAVAVGMAHGPAAGLSVLDALIEQDVPALRDYHLVSAARGELLERLGRKDEARTEFARAAAGCDNEMERATLLRRASG